MTRFDLMPGDWVTLTDLCVNVKVDCLSRDYIYYGWLNGRNEASEYDVVMPLWITEKVLRSNFFELVEVGDHGVATPAQHRDRYEKWIRKTKWKDIIIWYDRRTKKYNLHDMNGAKFQYIHELQHALRLAGIDIEFNPL